MKSANWYLMGYYKECPLIDWLVFKGWRRKFFMDVDIDYEPNKVIAIDHEYYFIKEDTALLDSIVSKKTKEKNFIHDYLKKCENGCNHLLRISRNIRKLDLKQFSNTELKNLLRVFADEFLKEMHFYLDMMSFENIFTDRMRKLLLKTVPKNKVGEYLQLISKPDRKNIINMEIESFDKLLGRVKQDKRLLALFKTKSAQEILAKLRLYDSSFLKIVQKHKERFCWTSTYGWNGKLLTEKDYIVRIKDTLSHKKAEQKTPKLPRLKDTNIVKDISFMKTHRDEIYNYVGYLIRPLLEEIADRYGMSHDNLIYLTDDEIMEIDNINYKKLIKERKEHYLIMKDCSKIEIISGKDVKNFKFENTEKKELKGVISNKGSFSGKAKVVMHAGEIHKVEKDDVLVTPMTNFNYLPIIHKVSAIITDEGGMLSHSAIISREFDIPCITGTEIATKVLKDGDFIEVDASKGIIRKIK